MINVGDKFVRAEDYGKLVSILEECYRRYKVITRIAQEEGGDRSKVNHIVAIANAQKEELRAVLEGEE